MNFNFDDFAREIHSSFQANFTLNEVKEILHLEDDGYQISKPYSIGKRLLLQRIILKGKKDGETSFNYDKQLFSGVNMWVADNLKGKSTIFKAIKFALTGKNSLGNKIKSWLEQIQLEFSIGDDIYTIDLDLSASSLNARLYHSSIDNIRPELDPVEKFKSVKGFENFIAQFFFDQLNYYPLKKVQSNQHSLNLVESDISWGTYYSSIYLQSKDYGMLNMGNQHGGVFQMLLGLDFTYSIYALEVMQKKKSRDLDIEMEKEKTIDNTDIVNSEANLKLELLEVQQLIAGLKNNSNRTHIEKLQQEISSKVNFREKIRKGNREVEDRLYGANGEHNSLRLAISIKKDQIDDIKKEVRKTKKVITEHQEYIDSGIFFSNLKVTECPHCEHTVNPEKYANEKENHVCMLCENDLGDREKDTSEWENRIGALQEDLNKYEVLITNEQNSLDYLLAAIGKIEKNSRTYERDLDAFHSQLSKINQEIVEMEEQMSKLTASSNENYFELMENFLKRKIDIEYKINSEGKQEDKKLNNKLQQQIDLIQFARQVLLDKRAAVGQDIFSNLENLMLSQLHALGLKSYTRVLINPENFAIYYFQGEIKNNFDDISEGEQLRAKLALYLSLIEMDIVKGIGRHPKLIILDSPGKEEGDATFLQGLKESLIHIDEAFGDKVQVFVGTANRTLQNTVQDLKRVDIRQTDEYLF
ncbi:putative nucleic acid-binding Zn-ribbon protein [Chitinophaga sp. W2I13]|uniref:hypothetical protein n=1 Tax=Chitinophaga sp. W2I13 TaxID=3373923 RepID=UPI003D1E1B27